MDRERGTGESMQVLAGEERGEYFLDYYRDLPDCSWHARIHGDGTHEDLENYEGQFGLPVKDDPAATEREHERIVAHNQRVTKLLKHKGFQP